MCGIAGLIRFGGGRVEAAVLERACAAMFHRGPDHTGVWVAPDAVAGLSAVRLAVLDPTPAANQPMRDATSRHHLVFNGEIYNFRALRRELAAAGDTFSTDGDTEVVLKACVRWGTGALSRFNGMWALAYYDAGERKGFVSRDRFGIKPLLYASSPTGLCFASEPRALAPLQSWDRAIDRDALAELLMFGYISSPKTIHSGARRLGPGELMEFGPRGVLAPRRHYSLPAEQRDGDDHGADPREAVRRALAESVDLRKVSDVPIGAFLSGGLDSSIIVAHLASVLGRRVSTFCVGYAEDAAYDESRYARLVAEYCGTQHHEIRLTREDVLAAVPRVLEHLGEPFGDSSVIPTWLVSRFAAQHVTVALSGDGGDELFGGYWRYLAHEALRGYERIPHMVRAGLIEPVLRGLGTSKSSVVGNRLRQFRKLLRASGLPGPFERHIAWSRILAPDWAASILGEAVERSSVQAASVAVSQLAAPFAGRDEVTRLMAIDVQHGLPSDMLQKVDVASMAHSLEVRVPFLDPGVVAMAMSLPGSLKVHQGLKKVILADAYRGRLPGAIVDRAKMGFEVPVGEYLRTDLREMFSDVVTKPVLDDIGGINHEAVSRLFAEHLERRGEHADVLFTLLSLCWWRRRGRLDSGAA